MSTLVGILLQASLPTLFWLGISAQDAPQLMPMLAESGADHYICHQQKAGDVLTVLDAAAENGVKVYAGFPDLISNPEENIGIINSHPAFEGYYLKDEPEVWDIDGLGKLVERFNTLDPGVPCYINLYPNWAWDEEKYASRIELFANTVDVPFFSFDQYPVTEVDGKVVVRPTWYRNLEEFSEMARRHGKPFWAFALTKSHYLGPPSPPAFYPVPTLGTLRLQVMSDLLYGAQCIQYFTFGGIYKPETLEKTVVFDIVREVNLEIKVLSPVFLGAKVHGVWHSGDVIPPYTKRFSPEAVPSLKELSMSGEGAVVSLLENGKHLYVAVQNRDCINKASLNTVFKKRVKLFGGRKARSFNLEIEPGDAVVFQLK